MQKQLKEIIDCANVPNFLLGANVFYKDKYFANGSVVGVQSFLENIYDDSSKGFSIKILTTDGINHVVDVVKGNGVNHYFNNEKNAHFDGNMKFVYQN